MRNEIWRGRLTEDIIIIIYQLCYFLSGKLKIINQKAVVQKYGWESNIGGKKSVILLYTSSSKL